MLNAWLAAQMVGLGLTRGGPGHRCGWACLLLQLALSRPILQSMGRTLPEATGNELEYTESCPEAGAREGWGGER